MKLLEQKILKDGIALNSDILKVDSFLNHQVDPSLMEAIGKEFANHFNSKLITKIVTVESSGIAPALMTALVLNVPLVVFKKQTSKILNDTLYQTEVKSFTKGNTYNLVVSKNYISNNDNVLIIDDFLASGEACNGIIRLLNMAASSIFGIGIVIEKTFQPGRKILEDMGFDVYSLARIKKMEKNIIEFV